MVSRVTEIIPIQHLGHSIPVFQLATFEIHEDFVSVHLNCEFDTASGFNGYSDLFPLHSKCVLALICHLSIDLNLHNSTGWFNDSLCKLEINARIYIHIRRNAIKKK